MNRLVIPGVALIALPLQLWATEQPAVTAAAQQPPTTVDDCLVPYGNGSYAAWTCDPEAKRYTTYVTLYAIRINHAGAPVYQKVWSGAIDQLVERIDGLVTDHRKSNATCRAYFHIAAFASGGAQWNRVTPSMQKWWDDDGGKDFPELCYSAEPGWADYVVFWLDQVETIPYSFVLPVPQTTFLYGSANAFGSGGFASGSFSGTATTTQMQVFQSSRSEWNVTAVVVPLEWRNSAVALGTPQHWTDKTGRWRWSKPDKDALKEALTFIQRTAAVLEAGSVAPPALPLDKPAKQKSKEPKIVDPEGTWNTNLPNTTARVTKTANGLRLEFAGSSEYAGYGAELLFDGPQWVGSANAPHCISAGRWVLRQEGELLTGSFECRDPGLQRRTGFVLLPQGQRD